MKNKTNSSNSNGRSNTKSKPRNKNYCKKSTAKSNYAPEYDKDDSTNDVSWYAQHPALLRDAASIPFSWSVGSPFTLDSPIASDEYYSVPGVCSILTAPSFGRSKDASSPINTAAFSAYSFTVHANSRNTKYNAPDLMLLFGAMSQVYSYIMFLQRAYGVALLYAQRNRYLPDALLTSMKIDPEDIRANLANFRYGINVLINKAASIFIPADIPIFKRHAFMYSNIYVGGTSIKDQLYLYNPFGFWKYTLENRSGAFIGKLEYTNFYEGQNHTVNSLLNYGNDMIDRIITSEDMNIMSGDILKAWGPDKIMKLSELPEQYPITPIYDSAVLEQIKNTTVVPHVGNLDVTQSADVSYLVHVPSAVSVTTQEEPARIAQIKGLSESKILTTQTAEPTPELVMENTRNMVGAVNFTLSEDKLTATTELVCGSEIALAMVIYRYEGTLSDWQLQWYALDSYPFVESNNATKVAAHAKTTALLSAFKFHPFRHARFWKYVSGSTVGYTDAFLEYDIDNYAIINNQELSKLHEAALMSLLNVPSLVKI